MNQSYNIGTLSLLPLWASKTKLQQLELRTKGTGPLGEVVSTPGTPWPRPNHILVLRFLVGLETKPKRGSLKKSHSHSVFFFSAFCSSPRARLFVHNGPEELWHHQGIQLGHVQALEPGLTFSPIASGRSFEPKSCSGKEMSRRSAPHTARLSPKPQLQDFLAHIDHLNPCSCISLSLSLSLSRSTFREAMASFLQSCAKEKVFDRSVKTRYPMSNQAAALSAIAPLKPSLCRRACTPSEE